MNINANPKSSPSIPFDREGQKVRREHLLALCRQENFPRYDAQGKWLLSVKGGDEWRDRVLQSYALYMGNTDDIALANTILMATPDDLNDFSGHHAAALLGLHEDKISNDVRQKLIESLSYVNDHAYRHLFRYTENCGLLNVLGLLEANRRFNRSHYRDKSLRFLEVFCRFLEDAGAKSQGFLNFCK